MTEKTTEQLKKEHERLEELVNNAYEQMHDIQRKLAAIETQKLRTQLDNLKLQEGSLIVGFAKHQDYHFTLAVCIKIKKSLSRKVSCVISEYRVDDGEYSLNVRNKEYNIPDFINLLEKFSFYFVGLETYQNTLLSLNTMEITCANASVLERSVAETAIN